MVGEKRSPEKLNIITEKQNIFLKNNEKKLLELGFDIQNIQTKQQATKIIGEFMKLKGVKRDDKKQSSMHVM